MGIVKDVKTLIENKPENPESPTINPEPPKKILIAEDDDMLREFYVELLKQQEYTVLQAVNGQEGLKIVTSEKPDLLILDLVMPVMDGKTMLYKIREIPEFKALPVIILTNAGTVDNIKETKLYNNADVFLIKSNINPEELINAVKMLV